MRSLVCWISLAGGEEGKLGADPSPLQLLFLTTALCPHGLSPSWAAVPLPPPCPGPASHSLGQEASTLTALVGLTALQEEQLGPVQDVHQHGQLGLH